MRPSAGTPTRIERRLRGFGGYTAPMSEEPKTPREAIEQVFPGGFTFRDEANAIVACAFRNGPLEDLHAGKWSELLEDSELSRITDEEMKMLMLNTCKAVEHLLPEKQNDPGAYLFKMMQYNLTYCRHWERSPQSE
jgi:hypothetical protein